MLRHGNSVEILVVKKQLCDRLNELITAKFQGDPEENDTIYFIGNQDEVIRAIEGLGQIKTSQAFPNMSSVNDATTRAVKGRASKFTVQTRYVMGGMVDLYDNVMKVLLDITNNLITYISQYTYNTKEK